MRSILQKAASDYRYLLENGYNPQSARRLVCDRHLLSKKESWYLLRCVMPERLAMARGKKLIGPEKIKSKPVAVDGYNTLITLEAKKVLRGDDGVLRDLSGVFGGYRTSRKTRRALLKLLKRLKGFGPKYIEFYFDKNVSKSGELAALARTVLAHLGMGGDAVAEGAVDHRLKAKGGAGWIIMTTDSAIMDGAKKILQPIF